MIKKLALSVLIVLLTTLIIVSPVAAAKSYYAERFNVTVDLQKMAQRS